uniref:Uncharacterized protein n=1 Tax=CrAss-like virus sp. ctYsL76 TaxID=2826826 RepID=A0A8S5QMZ8_9CAUD|nr:MAG TPA: hypothetical protein [CrAss-like virus sp. ctYsL76]
MSHWNSIYISSIDIFSIISTSRSITFITIFPSIWINYRIISWNLRINKIRINSYCYG